METNIEQKILNYEANLIKQSFFSKEALLFLKDAIPDFFFSNQIHEVIWKTFVFIDEQNEELTRSSVEDVFSLSDNSAYIKNVWNILEEEYPDETHWKYQFRYLFEVYAKANILKVLEQAKSDISEKSSSHIIDWLSSSLEKYDKREEIVFDMNTSITRAKEDIILRKEGKINPYIKTGSQLFDSMVKIDFNQIILIAAARKIGKTKFTIHMLMEMLAVDPSIAVKYYSFELSEKEMMYEMLSRETQLSSEQLQSKDYALSDDEIKIIEEAFDRIENYDFNISTTPTPVAQIKKDFDRFCKQRNSNRCVLIIDNMGLLKEKGRSQTEIDDYVAKTLVDIRDKTKALILPIHHMTKDMDREERLKDGYRPLLRHLKGSTRIQDYANKVLLLHRPGFYNDLVTKEESKGVIKLSNGKFKRTDVIKKLFIADLALNRGGKTGTVRFLHKLQFCQFKEWK